MRLLTCRIQRLCALCSVERFIKGILDGIEAHRVAVVVDLGERRPRIGIAGIDLDRMLKALERCKVGLCSVDAVVLVEPENALIGAQLIDAACVGSPWSARAKEFPAQSAMVFAMDNVISS